MGGSSVPRSRPRRESRMQFAKKQPRVLTEAEQLIAANLKEAKKLQREIQRLRTTHTSKEGRLAELVAVLPESERVKIIGLAQKSRLGVQLPLAITLIEE